MKIEKCFSYLQLRRFTEFQQMLIYFNNKVKRARKKKEKICRYKIDTHSFSMST